MSAPAAARRFCLDVLQCYGLDTLAADAVHRVSELVTNAVLHAGPPVSVHVTCVDDRVRVEVADGTPRVETMWFELQT